MPESTGKFEMLEEELGVGKMSDALYRAKVNALRDVIRVLKEEFGDKDHRVSEILLHSVKIEL